MGKYAVVLGINYVGVPDATLHGCCNDARAMCQVLKNKGFSENNIIMLVDDTDDTSVYPTPQNVSDALKWLVTDRASGDVIFFSYSGHGARVNVTTDMHETDDMDEVILLEGNNTLYLLLDNDLKRYFSVLPDGVLATCIFDCCHSDTALDSNNDLINSRNVSNGNVSGSGSDSERAIKSTRSRLLPSSLMAKKMGNDLNLDITPTTSSFAEAMLHAHGPLSAGLAFEYMKEKLEEAVRHPFTIEQVEDLLRNRDIEQAFGTWKYVLVSFANRIKHDTNFTASGGATKVGQALFAGGSKPHLRESWRHFEDKPLSFWFSFANELESALMAIDHDGALSPPVSRAVALGWKARSILRGMKHGDRVVEEVVVNEDLETEFWVDFGHAFVNAVADHGLRSTNGIENALKLGQLFASQVKSDKNFNIVAHMMAGLSENPVQFWHEFGYGFLHVGFIPVDLEHPQNGSETSDESKIDHVMVAKELARSLVSSLLLTTTEGGRDVSGRSFDRQWASDFMPSVDAANVRDVSVVMTGCLQDELSMEATLWSGESHGAFTSALLECLAEDAAVNNFDLVQRIRQKVLQHGFTQSPTLACSRLQKFLVFICED